MIILTDAPLDADAVTESVRRDGNGAVVTFLGTTRDNFGGKTVTRLEYEAYDAMAVKKLEEVRASLCADYAIEDVAIAHQWTWGTSAWWLRWPAAPSRRRSATRR